MSRLDELLRGIGPKCASTTNHVRSWGRLRGSSLYLRVHWHPLSDISRLTGFGGVRLTVVMTFPERTDVVLGRSRRDFGSVLLVARRMPSGDSVRDDLGRGGSHQSEVGITNRLSLNSLSLRYH